MAVAFKILGALIMLWGFFELWVASYGIDIYSVMGLEVPRMIYSFTYLMAIMYGFITIVVANHLQHEEPELEVIDMTDPYAIPVKKPRDEKPPLSFHLWQGARAMIWGVLIGLFYVLVFFNLYPGAEQIVFGTPDGAEQIAGKVRKAFYLFSIILAVALALLGMFVLRLKGALPALMIGAGAALSGLGVSAAALTYPTLGASLFGQDTMRSAYIKMGHLEGRPEGWTLDREFNNRMRILRNKHPRR